MEDRILPYLRPFLSLSLMGISFVFHLCIFIVFRRQEEALLNSMNKLHAKMKELSMLIERHLALIERPVEEAVQAENFTKAKVKINIADQQFLKKVREVILAQISKETFGVAELGTEVGLSRSQLHRKLKSLTGNAPSELIRMMRMQKAKQLLEIHAGNITEIALDVGYDNLSHFSKSFKKTFGCKPSEYMKETSVG